MTRAKRWLGVWTIAGLAVGCGGSTSPPSGDDVVGPDATAQGGDDGSTGGDGAQPGADASIESGLADSGRDAASDSSADAQEAGSNGTTDGATDEADVGAADAGDAGASEAAASEAGGSEAGSSEGGSEAGALGCLGAALPTTAPASIAVGGVVSLFTSGGESPLSGVTVVALASSNDSVLYTATTDSSGAFSASLSTGGVPIDAYLHATKTGDVDEYVYAASPFAADAPNVDFTTFSNSSLGLLEGYASVSQSPANGILALTAIDCSGSALTGATFSATSGGVATGMTTAPLSGVTYVFNVAPATVQVGAQYGTMTLRSRDVNVRAGVVTAVSIGP